MVRATNEAIASKIRVDGAWLVETSSSQIKLTKKFGRKTPKVISFMLQRQTNGLYFMEPVTYEFHSKLSHFDYLTSENRWAREKKFFIKIFDTLKRVDAIKYIENIDTFIQVNTHNKVSNKSALQNQLKFIKTRVKKTKKKV